MVMKSKTPKPFDWVSVICVAIIIIIVSNSVYRFWVLSQTDWNEFFRRVRPVDYLATAIILVILFVLRFWARSKP